MTTLCMTDYTEPPLRATDILHNPRGLWGALKFRASDSEGTEIAGILQAISEHSSIVHRLIYGIASRDIKIEVTARRENAHWVAQQQLKQERPHSAALRLDQEAAFPLAKHVPSPVTAGRTGAE